MKTSVESFIQSENIKNFKKRLETVTHDCRSYLSDGGSSLESHTHPFVSVANVIGDELKLPIDSGWIFSVSRAPGS